MVRYQEQVLQEVRELLDGPAALKLSEKALNFVCPDCNQRLILKGDVYGITVWQCHGCKNPFLSLGMVINAGNGQAVPTSMVPAAKSGGAKPLPVDPACVTDGLTRAKAVDENTAEPAPTYGPMNPAPPYPPKRRSQDKLVTKG